MGLFDKLMGRELPERRDARTVYFRLLEQARTPGFFGPGRFADDYDGRIDVITLHMAVMMMRLRSEGEDGDLLRQALFDEMKDDFEIALREEGISDTGVKKRIKPMIGHFYDRLKAYTDAIESPDPRARLSESILTADETETPLGFKQTVADYALGLLDMLKDTSLDLITSGKFYFPEV
ncbi:MAG: ubiquinol-cytochrome C chaperone family protein [Litorimonas sp.]